MKPLVVLLIAAVLTSPLGAQDSARTTVALSVAATTPPHRNPRLAMILGSLIPGAGHIYAGEYVRGFLYNQSVLTPIGIGVMGITVSSMCQTRCNRGRQVLGEALSVVVVGAGIWQWVSTARDAARAAERENVKHSRKAVSLKPIVGAPVGPHGEWNLGVEIPW